MVEIKPIETIYKGFRFRSRLEARWAVLFDAMGIKYLYEPQGYKLSNGDCYLPDFYLPDFEVKGVMSSDDSSKIKFFVSESKLALTVGYDDFTFSACNNHSYYPEHFCLERKDDSILMKCNKCGTYYFIGTNGSWECTGCGYYDGDNTSQWICTGDLDFECDSEKYEKTKFKKAIEKAKQARFEHGECGWNGR